MHNEKKQTSQLGDEPA